jgi:hypothetical protein
VHALLIAAVVVGVYGASLDASQRPAAMPCGTTPRYVLPRDDGSQRPDFAAFRRQLQEAIARDDRQAILEVVDPTIRLDFGDGGGRDEFARRMADPELHFLDELRTILSLGGRLTSPTGFGAPYVTMDFPQDLDGLECAVVTGSGVRVREAPGLDARILTHVSHLIVQWLADDGNHPDWTHVRLPTGTTGYIAARYVRSPAQYRGFFEFKDGRWWMMTFVTGD